MAGAATLVMLCAAVVGSIFGFLRFNTHPARVFMGDAGSQFIGFSLAVALVLLTQRVNSGLSMPLPALIVGLPIVDILAVLAQRIAAGGSWFRATRNHLHHRLLDLGFKHHQVVVIIYVVQAAMVISASFCAYASDALVLGIYVCVCSALFAAIAIAERRGWRLSGSASTPPWGELLALRAHRAIIVYVSYSLPVYLLLSGFLIGKVSFDFAVVAGIVLLAVAFRLAFRLKWRTEWLLRLALYSGAASIVFLAQNQDADTSVWHWLPDIYLASLFLAIALASRLGGEQGFVTTPLDVLLVILLLGAALLGLQHPEYADGTRLVLQLAVLFYASELIVASGGAKRYLSEISLVGLSLLLLGKTLGGA